MIIWGGGNSSYVNTGSRYNPSTNRWTATSTTNAPDARVEHTAVWTGSEMIVWGGRIRIPIGVTNTGGRSDPGPAPCPATTTTTAPADRAAPTPLRTGGHTTVRGRRHVT